MKRNECHVPVRRTVRLIAILPVLLFALPAPRAQDLHEILVGSVGDIPTDEFSCGKVREAGPPCDLSFRFYCVDQPDEINSPAFPVSGYPTFKEKKRLYLAQSVHTGNFTLAAKLGPGHIWHMIWDGVKNADTPSHAGYYAAVSQVVERGELGNAMSSTCLPVTGQYACFGLMNSSHVNAVQNSPLGNISPIGGMSPIPVPILARNGTQKISLAWEQAAGQMSRDGATLPIEGYQLYVYPNPVTPPTEKELQDAAIPIGKVLPLADTSFEVDRSDPALADAVTLSAAIRMVYRGPVLSSYFSANGQVTGLDFPDTAATREMDDASTGTGAVARAIDIEDLFLEVRETGEPGSDSGRLLYATLELVGEPAGKLMEGTTARIYIDFNDEGLGETFAEPGKKDTQDITLQATLSRNGQGPIQAAFSGLPGVEASSTIDTQRARVVFVVPLDKVLGAVGNDKLRAADIGGGRRQVLVWAETSRDKDMDRIPNTNDGGTPTVAGEAIKFSF